MLSLGCDLKRFEEEGPMPQVSFELVEHVATVTQTNPPLAVHRSIGRIELI